MASPHSPVSAARSLAAYVSSDQGAEVARAVVQLAGEDPSPLHGGGLGGAARVSTGEPVAETILAEMGNMSLDAACESVFEICQTGARVIVLGVNGDLSTYRALRTAGALEYFAFPVSAEEVIAANTPAEPQALAALPQLAVPGPDCIAVMGCNGGVGTSLLAQSLAFHAASEKGPALRTALIDADLRFGSQAIDLDRKDTPGLQEALSAPNRVDATFLSATMEQLNDRLSLFSYQALTSPNLDQLEAAFGPLIQSMKSTFDTLVVDLPRTTLVSHPELAQEFDALVLMIPPGYAGVNIGNRLMALLKSQAPDLKILPVLSEFRQDAKLTVKDITKAIHADVVGVLPDSTKMILRAHRAAKPLIECQPRSRYAKVTKSLWELSMTDTATPASKPKRSFLKKSAA